MRNVAINEKPIQTTVVGSYPTPSWLHAQPSTSNLRDAIMVVLKTQELAGIDLISDGELSRFNVNHPESNGMIDYFIGPMEGVNTELTQTEIEAFRNQPGMGFRKQPAGVVHGKVDEGTLHLITDYAFAKQLTTKPLKLTVTSPYMLSKTLLDNHYGDIKALAMDIAETLRKQVHKINAPVVQVDEANLPGSPADAPWAAQVINHVLGGARERKGVHLCFGNYGGQTIQKGFFKELLPFFNALECDHLVLECARRGYPELEIFQDLKSSISLGLGVIDIKDNEVESPEEVARRIEDAVELLGADRIKWVHPDCGFHMLHRSVADRKMETLVQGRDLYLGGQHN